MAYTAMRLALNYEPSVRDALIRIITDDLAGVPDPIGELYKTDSSNCTIYNRIESYLPADYMRHWSPSGFGCDIFPIYVRQSCSVVVPHDTLTLLRCNVEFFEAISVPKQFLPVTIRICTCDHDVNFRMILESPKWLTLPSGVPMLCDASHPFGKAFQISTNCKTDCPVRFTGGTIVDDGCGIWRQRPVILPNYKYGFDVNGVPYSTFPVKRLSSI